MPRAHTHIKVSLRSVDDFDTSQVSHAFGGGGHAAASSFITTKENVARWRDMA
jgi:nanoRNase/pAp phosphatase (c-di-AMP/oligoRNAs hydrolase)